MSVLLTSLQLLGDSTSVGNAVLLQIFGYQDENKVSFEVFINFDLEGPVHKTITDGMTNIQ